jgi:NADPH-dependent glutamate synthase beta chain and related oxidoreductases
MRERSVPERVRSFEEVNLGYTHDQAIAEAKRCLGCKTRPCVEGCPVNVDIPDFIGAIAGGRLPEAVKILTGKNNLPAVCGRVCPQEEQCEKNCVLGKRGGGGSRRLS